ncbi:MAG: substrate-binding periplasmic protein [Thermodesulfobacteriota bacterium]
MSHAFHNQSNSIRFLVALFVFIQMGTAYSQDPQGTSIVLSTFAGPPLSTRNQTGLYDRIVIEAFHRIGIHRVEIIHLPAERSLANANAGITDGDFVRISGLEAWYPELVQVPEKIADFEFVGFTKKKKIRIKSWEECKTHHVGIVRGWKLLEKNLAGAVSLTRVRDQNLLFTLLEKDRADVIVYSRLEGYEIMKQAGIKNVMVLEPPLEIREMFLYLHKRHDGLVRRLCAALMDMKKDGAYERIASQTIAPLLLEMHHE